MQITINRESPVNGLTFGDMLIDGKHAFWTLETAPVPADRYRILVDYSPAHRAGQIHVIGMHLPSGTYLGEQIQIGTGKSMTEVLETDTAMASLLSKVKTALCGNFVWLNVVDTSQ